MPHDELFETSEVFSSENAGEMYGKLFIVQSYHEYILLDYIVFY